MSEYKSSIISLYGDIDNVRNDNKAVILKAIDIRLDSLNKMLDVIPDTDYYANSIVDYQARIDELESLRHYIVGKINND